MPDIVSRQGITPITLKTEVKNTSTSNKTVTKNDTETEIEKPTVINENSANYSEVTEEPVVIEEEDKVITEEDVHAIFEKGNEIDPDSKRLLEEAKEETEAMSEDAKLEEQYTIPAEEIEPSDNSIKQIFDPYGLTDEEVLQMMDIIKEYKSTNNTKGVYAKLPNMMKMTIDSIIGKPLPPINALNAARERAVALLLDNFLQDARFAEVMDEYDNSMQQAIKDMNEEYDALYADAINATFDKIEEIRAENPEQAERIETVRDAYNNALELTMEKERLTHMSAKKLNKTANRFSNEAFSFNKRVNTTPMKFPKIEDLYQAIRTNLPEEDYSGDDIIKFLTLVCMTHTRLLDIENDLAETAYIYRLISTIHTYTFTDPTLDDTGKKIFENIMGVIDQIKSL